MDLFTMMGLVQQFMSEMTTGSKFRWSWQVKDGDKDVEYFELKRPMNEQDWHQHFSGKRLCLNPRTRKFQGSAAVACKFEGDQIRFFCLDCDNPKAVHAARNLIIPLLEGVDWIWENSGTEDFPKGHLWFKVDCQMSALKAWVFQIFDQANLNPRDPVLQFELYPIIKENFLIRMPGGFHLRNGRVNSVEWRGQTSSEIEFILRAFSQARRLTQSEIESKLTPSVSAPAHRTRSKKGQFLYSSLNLSVPDGLPKVIDKVAKDCQAINKLLWDSSQKNFLSKHGGLVHLWGLYLWNLAMYNDLINRGKNAPEGQQWMEGFLRKHRTREWSSDNWNLTSSENKSNPEKLFPSCQTWERDFGLCKGCSWADNKRIRSPKTLFYGKKIQREALEEFKLVDAATVRRTTFPRFKKRLLSLVGTGAKKNFLLASGQSTGKSWAADELAVELANQGKNILISVPTAKLALEHRDRIRGMGGDAFLLMSHKNIFTYNPPRFEECPQYIPIQEYIRYGLSAGQVRKDFCDSCRYRPDCPFPDQYGSVKDPKHRIVIIQHAHFGASDSLYSLLKKEFDVLFVDEAVVDSMMTRIKPTEAERVLISQLPFDWASSLSKWMEEGGRPGQRLTVPLEDLREADRVCTQSGLKCRIPEFIRCFNQDLWLEVSAGVYSFNPLPMVPLTVILDATPPLEMYQIYLNDREIEVWGADEIFDYRSMNSNNKVIQVLDSSMSKTSMRGTRDDSGEWQFERLADILEFIGDFSRKTPTKKILITTYKEFESVAEVWLQQNYPDCLNRILISHMMVGTNQFQDCDVQFLLAGVYPSANMLNEEVYRLKIAANYWNRLNGRKEIPNPWLQVGENASPDVSPEVIHRIQPVGNRALKFRYPQFSRYVLKEFFQSVVEKFMIGKTQQALRLRYNNDSERVTYIFGNFDLPSFLITESVVEEDLLGYLRIE